MPPASSLFAIALRYALLLVLLAFTVCAVREGIAAYNFRQNTPAAVQKAMAWDPQNPVYPSTAAKLIHLYGDYADPDLVIRLSQNALQLSPFEAAYCVDLAEAYDWAGRPALAAPLFRRALQLFPNSPEINWKAANFYVRTGKSSEALPALKKVLTSDAISRNQVFALTLNARIDTDTVIADVLPLDASAFVEYLNFQVDRGDMAGAAKTWDHLLLLPSSIEIDQTFHYFDALIKSRNISRASQVWSSLATRFPSRTPPPASDENLVTNGNFHTDILNGGFGWRVYPVKGAEVTQPQSDSGSGGRYLRIDFDGSANPYYDAVAQFVRVKRNSRYTFTAMMRSVAITTDSGVCVQISDAYDPAKILGSTDSLSGSVPWSEHTFSFATGANTDLVLMKVVRPLSNKFDSKIAGSFGLRMVSIVTAR
jgi:tetratricopeptide (TPR) repeat protein